MNLVLLLVALLGGGPPLRVSPPEWDLGSIPAQAGVQLLEARLENLTERPVAVRLLSTCDCLSVEPASLDLPPRGQAVFRLRYDPARENGVVEKYLVLSTDLPELPKALYLVRGEVTGAAADDSLAESPRAAAARAGGEVPLDFYYAAGCRSCLRFLGRTLPRLEEKLGIGLPVREHNILDPETYAKYRRLLDSRGEQERAFPALRVGSRLLQGEREIRERAPAGAAGSGRGGFRDGLRGARRGSAGNPGTGDGAPGPNRGAAGRRRPRAPPSPTCPRPTARTPRATTPIRPTTSCAPGPAPPRCCATATSPPCRRPRSDVSTRCSRPCGRARRCVVRRATSGGTAASSTPRARCAAACAGWASRVTSRGGAADAGRAGWCC